MIFPRLPDWAVYAAIVLAILVVSLSRRESVDAPSPDSYPDPAEGPLLGPLTEFDPTVVVDAPQGPFQPQSGTAFAIASEGLWLTARHVVEGCRQPALVVGGGQAIAADMRLAPQADLAMLITEGGPTPLPVAADAPLRRGQRAFHPGYPQGRPGEVTTRLLGRETLRIRGRGARDEPVLAWAEAGRSRGLDGTLSGLSGGPALDREGRVIGVTIAEAPRRGRIYTTAPDTLAPVVRGVLKREGAIGRAMTVDNYGRVADTLRRNLKVARVVCLSV